ncbi:MAG: LemA family protein [Crocinitomicaceae bacterium]
MGWIIFIGGFVLLFIIIVWSVYNRLVIADNQVDEALSLIDVQLKKRFELIPNLVEAVKGYNAHEANVLLEIAERRSQIPSATTDKANLDASITGTLRNFRIQVENYPDLLANAQFSKLMDSLTSVEDELAMARRYYNGTVRDLHNKMEVFPNVLFVSISGVKKKLFYEIDANEAESPNINLSE